MVLRIVGEWEGCVSLRVRRVVEEKLKTKRQVWINLNFFKLTTQYWWTVVKSNQFIFIISLLKLA